MGPDELTRRLAELAESAPASPLDRRLAVRRRVRAVRRRRTVVGAAAAVAAVGLLAPAAALLAAPAGTLAQQAGPASGGARVPAPPSSASPSPAAGAPPTAAAPSAAPPTGALPEAPGGPSASAGPSTPLQVVATFDFPSQGAVAEILLPPGPVLAGVEQRVVVRVRTERGQVGGVDMQWGDDRADYLGGAPRCTPDAGPTVVDLSATHVWPVAGRYLLRAVPQVLSGCRDGRGIFTTAGTTPATGELVVEPGPQR